MQNLYNLTYQGHQYVSTREPDSLPEDEYSFIEITYNETLIISVKGIYKYGDEKKDIFLADLDIMHYLKNIKSFEPIIQFQGVDQPSDKEEKLFIIAISSYLSYFSFKSSYELSLDLLDNKAFDYFIGLEKSNLLESSWSIQVQETKETFGYLFPNEFIPLNREEEKEKIVANNEKEEYMNEHDLEEQVKILVKRNMKKYENQFMKSINKALESSIKKINEEADSIAKEIKIFKKRLLADVSKMS